MTDQNNSEGPFKVGYGKPPKHTQFAKGKSGNPKGRGKGVRNFATEINEELNSRLPIRGKWHAQESHEAEGR